MQIGIVHANGLARQVENDDGGQGADQEYDIEPTVIEIKVQIAQHLCDDHPVLGWHIHAHQQHRGTEVHAHDLAQNQHDYVARLARRNAVEELL